MNVHKIGNVLYTPYIGELIYSLIRIIDNNRRFESEKNLVFLKYLLYLTLKDKPAIKRSTLGFQNIINKNSIIITKFSNNSLETQPNTKILSIKEVLSLEEIEKTHDEITILRLGEHLYINLKDNNFIINTYYFGSESEKEELTYPFDLALCYFKPFLDLDKETKLEIINLDIEKITNELEIKLLKTQLEQKLTNPYNYIFKSLEESINKVKTEIKSLLERYDILLDQQEKLSDRLIIAGDKNKRKFENFINPLVDYLKKAIENYEILNVKASYNGDLEIKFAPQPIIFYEPHHLKKILPNQSLSKTHLSYIEKVLDGTHSFYVASHRVIIKLTKKDLPTYDFKTMDYGSVLRETKNQHALYDNGKGCRGTFGPRFIEIGRELDIIKFIRLILQYLRSINVADVLGARMVKVLPIVNNETKLIEFSGYAQTEYTPPRALSTLE